MSESCEQFTQVKDYLLSYKRLIYNRPLCIRIPSLANHDFMEYHRILCVCVWRSQCFDGRADLIVLDVPNAPRPTAPVKITSTGCQTDLMPLKGRIKLLYLGVPVVYQPCRFHIYVYMYIYIYIISIYNYIYISIPAYLGNGFKYCENFRYLGI